MKTYKIMLFRFDGLFVLQKETALDAMNILDDLIKSGRDKSCVKIVVAGPGVWWEHNPA